MCSRMSRNFAHSPMSHFAVFLVLLLPGTIGCGTNVNLPPRAKVTGQVTVDGQPLMRGIITFVPDNAKGTRGPVAIGTIDSDGRYDLTTDRTGNQGDGAIVGFHRIRIEAREEPKGESEVPPKPLIPMRYFDSDQSGLTAEVKAGEGNVVNLTLKRNP